MHRTHIFPMFLGVLLGGCGSKDNGDDWSSGSTTGGAAGAPIEGRSGVGWLATGVSGLGGATTSSTTSGGNAMGGNETGGATTISGGTTDGSGGAAGLGGAGAGGALTEGNGLGGNPTGGSLSETGSSDDSGAGGRGENATGGRGLDGQSSGGRNTGANAGGGALAGETETGGTFAGGANAGGGTSSANDIGGADAGDSDVGGTHAGGTGAGGEGMEGGSAGASGANGTFALDCGPIGWAVEAHGPPSNRVNYVVIGDGYSASDLVAGGTFEQHIATAMAKRFSVPIGEVYSRYRNFVNICALKLESPSPICDGSTLGCCGDDQSRLAQCNERAVLQALNANLPESFVVDWRAVVLNGANWWNTGAATMLWSGGHPDAAGAALHEGGHGFHQLADEYTSSGAGCTDEYGEVNSTADLTNTAGKWDLWLGYDQVGATGLQSTFEGSRYCTSGQYRPSSNSMMNMLFGDDPNTSYNSVSREQMIFTIWRAVVPIDSTSPDPGVVSNPRTLTVKVIDPAVIDVDWTVDGTVVAARGGETFDLAAQELSAGTHTIAARAYDNADDNLVRYRTGTCPAAVDSYYCARPAWARSEQSVTWTVTVP